MSQNLVNVCGKEFGEFVNSNTFESRPVESASMSVMQYADQEGVLQAQAIYRKGIKPEYQIREVDTGESGLSADQRIAYIQGSGLVCPFCGGMESMDRHAPGVDYGESFMRLTKDNELLVNVVCRGCEKTWVDRFTLSGIHLKGEAMG